MAREIERKFLVADDGWQAAAGTSKTIRQAYLSDGGKASVRVRVVDDSRATLTIKSARPGHTRSEFEYDIPVADALELLALRRGTVIEKQRYLVPAGNLTWEVDVFGGAHDGLVIAEIELPDANTDFDRPPWLGAEVTDDPRYYNAQLAAPPSDDNAA